MLSPVAWQALGGKSCTAGAGIYRPYIRYRVFVRAYAGGCAGGMPGKYRQGNSNRLLPGNEYRAGLGNTGRGNIQRILFCNRVNAIGLPE